MPFPLKIAWHGVDMFNPSSVRALRFVVDQEDPDVILTHNLKGLGISVARAIQSMGIFHIHTMHDVQLSVPSGLVIYGQEHTWINRTFPRKWYEAGMKRAMGNSLRNIKISLI